MKHLICLILCTPFWYLFLQYPTNVSASTWEQLHPKDVYNQSTVIVIGSYDFAKEPESDEFMFLGYDFRVGKVLKGEVPEQLIAGIQMYDVSWAKEHQSMGGEFLLLLEETEYMDFLIPVVGPNGMVPLYNGQVIDESKERKDFYQAIITPENENKGKSMLIFFGIAILAAPVPMVILRMIHRKRLTR